MRACAVARRWGVWALFLSVAVLGGAPVSASPASSSVEVTLAAGPHPSTLVRQGGGTVGLAAYTAEFDVTNTGDEIVWGGELIFEDETHEPTDPLRAWLEAANANGLPCWGVSPRQHGCFLGQESTYTDSGVITEADAVLHPGATVRVWAMIFCREPCGARFVASVQDDGVTISNELRFGVGQLADTGSEPGWLVIAALVALVLGTATRRLARR